jgi:transcriptional regulator with XRE-family HTH domain
MPHRNFRELEAKMSPAARARAEELADQMEKELGLDELREARDITQETLAKALNISQGAVSKMERRADMYISSLQGIVRALGGKMEIRAIFPDGSVAVINQFSDLEKHNGRRNGK